MNFKKTHGWLLSLAMIGTVASAVGQIEVEVKSTPTATSGTVSDKAVAKVAAGLVAAPGAPLASTEFGQSTAVAPAPPVRLQGDQLLVDGQTTASKQAVRDAAELLRLLNVVPTAPKPKEEQESGNDAANEIFEQEQQAKALLGDNPNVIYRIQDKKTPLPDPMIVPWIRNAIVLKERYEAAINLLAQNKITEGTEELKSIAAEFPESDYGIQASRLLNKLANLPADTAPPQQKVTPAPIAGPEITVDTNVKPSTVIFDAGRPNENRVMISGRGYKVGDKIRGRPDHKILEIHEDEVVIEVSRGSSSKKFTLPVRPTSGQNQ